ncbi:hypothetical protein [Klebsiella michiganensis]|uniref:hypothetical protein n=1 Tax=Klebsiella michiganensis TaxID=1134687 RepID=UPI001D191B0E|nr:hypothetical protein [Klebsiella michiganensis]
MNISTVNELIHSLESAGELSIKETKVMALAKAHVQLAAENVGMKAFGDKLSEMHNALNGEGTGIQGRAEVACQQLALEAAMEEFDAIETPATDRIVAGIKADAAAPLVSALKVIANSEQHNGDTVVCDFDTLISVAAGALRDYYAKQLREGAK